jgi:serine/threonine protein kinase
MLADLGISRIKKARNNPHQVLVSGDLIGEVTPTAIRRVPGTYTAPEIENRGFQQHDGRASDVWSFGCVLSVTLAFALGGTSLALGKVLAPITERYSY